MRRFVLTIVAFVIAAACFFVLPPQSGAQTDKIRRAQNAIAGSYIVVVKREDRTLFQTDPSVEAEAFQLSDRYGAKVDKVYSTAIKGFSAKMSEAQAVQMSLDPRVLVVEEDFQVYLSDQQINPTDQQINPELALDRIDQRNLPLDHIYNFFRTGTGVHVYIMDTGIRTTHLDFEGRASIALPVNDTPSQAPCDGHGTHVAGLAGSATYGAAKNIWLHSLRVFDCNSDTTPAANIFEAVDWVTANRMNPAVVNMSFGGSASGPPYQLEIAISNSIASGITYVASANNNNSDACSAFPARVPEVITVAASTAGDGRWGGSNWGPCVDIFAPLGSLSTWNTSDTSTIFRGGTSQAAPLVAGVAALFLQTDPTASPAIIAQRIIDHSTKNVMNETGGPLNGSPNRLLYSLIGPTAATAFIEGRIVTQDRRGISNATIMVRNLATSGTRTTRSSSFGYFRVDDRLVPESYLITVAHRSYQFEPITIHLTDSVSGLIITANP